MASNNETLNEKSNGNTCLACGEWLKPEGVYCMHCGTRREDVFACFNCANFLQRDAAFCIHCGTKQKQESFSPLEEESGLNNHVMIRDTLVSELTKTEKKWLALAIVTAIVSDNKVSEDEIKHLQDAWTYLENKEDVERLVSYVRKREVPTLKPLKIKPKLAVMMMVYLIRTVVSDAKLKEVEFKALENLAIKLGIFGDLKEAILRWAVDLSLMNKRVLEFLEWADHPQSPLPENPEI